MLEIRAKVAVASTELTDIGVKVCPGNKTGGVKQVEFGSLIILEDKYKKHWGCCKVERD